MSLPVTTSSPADEPAAPTRRSWLKRLGAALGGALLASPALARATRSPLQVQEFQPFLGEIMLCAFGLVPKGFAACNGQLLPINQNQALFSLLGTTYGGDGRVNFALPNLQGRVPCGSGTSPSSGNDYPLGQRAGSETTTLTQNTLPSHAHSALASSAVASLTSPQGAVPAVPTAVNLNGEAVAVLAYNASSGAAANTTTAGGSVPFNNQSPYLTIQYCIALQGIFPSQN
ncbi:MAG: phage tail protein [Janthinobacterium lividum]